MHTMHGGFERHCSDPEKTRQATKVLAPFDHARSVAVVVQLVRFSCPGGQRAGIEPASRFRIPLVFAGRLLQTRL